jgi:Tfp pilus assembly protein PilF
MAKRHEEREARARLALGLLLYEINKNECAAEVLRAGLSYDPGLVEAHVWLGFVYGEMVRYEEMIGAFREAIRNPRAARRTIGREPEEVSQIRLILYALPESPTPMPSDERWNPAVPREIREAWELVEAASEYIGAGRDAQAVDALEKSLKLDPVSPHATSLLVFAYLLLESSQRVAWGARSVLWEVSPWLARLIFRS